MSASILTTKAIISPSVRLFATDSNLLRQNVASLNMYFDSCYVHMVSRARPSKARGNLFLNSYFIHFCACRLFERGSNLLRQNVASLQTGELKVSSTFSVTCYVYIVSMKQAKLKSV